jgi:hypothetical protein
MIVAAGKVIAASVAALRIQRTTVGRRWAKLSKAFAIVYS